MKKLLIFSFVIFLVSTMIVNAEEMNNTSKCKTMFDGKCVEYYANPVENKCKTMENGICTEYFNYNTSINSDNYIAPRRDMKYLNKKEQAKVCKNTFGFLYFLDSFYNPWSWDSSQARVYITKVDANSPAQRAGLQIGDEIQKINGNRVLKFKGDDFNNYLENQEKINLEIKLINGGKKNVTLERLQMCTLEEKEPFFEQYWTQICPLDLKNASKWVNSVGAISNKLSASGKSTQVNDQSILLNWKNKQTQFRNGFNLCLANNYNENDVNICLNKLVDRTLGTISQEQNLEMQRSTLQAQQQINQQQVNAMNNYSDALRNQHVKIDADVYHYGSIDVNSNVNINGNYYHHYW